DKVYARILDDCGFKRLITHPPGEFEPSRKYVQITFEVPGEGLHKRVLSCSQAGLIEKPARGTVGWQGFARECEPRLGCRRVAGQTQVSGELFGIIPEPGFHGWILCGFDLPAEDLEFS